MVSWDAQIKSSSKHASLDATCFDIKYYIVQESEQILYNSITSHETLTYYIQIEKQTELLACNSAK